MTMMPWSADTSTESPSLIRASSAIDFGIRSARLLPHFVILLVTFSLRCVYPGYHQMS